MEVPTRSHPKDLDVPDATFTPPDLTTFTRLDVLGLEVTAQLLEPDRTVLACRVVEPDDWCRRCGCQGVPRDTVTRELAHEPFGWRPTTLLLTVRRYRCTECAHVWRQDTTAAAEPRAKISRARLRWGLVGIVVQHLSMARVAEGLGVSWNTAPQSSHPQDPYILCLTASPQHPRYALRIRKSRFTPQWNQPVTKLGIVSGRLRIFTLRMPSRSCLCGAYLLHRYME